MSVKKIGKAIEPNGSFWAHIAWMVPTVGEFRLANWQSHPEIKALGPEPDDSDNYEYRKSWFSTGLDVICKNPWKKAEYEKLKEEYQRKFSLVKERIREEFKNKSQSQPVQLEEDKHYLYKGSIYKFNRGDYSDDEMLFQIMELEDKERQKFERLKHKFTTAQEEEKKPKREPIPEDVRIAVWRRDEGKCSKCGSREKLEYDHIVPVAKGGSNTARNIELLCEQCNRSKSANIQ